MRSAGYMSSARPVAFLVAFVVLVVGCSGSEPAHNFSAWGSYNYPWYPWAPLSGFRHWTSASVWKDTDLNAYPYYMHFWIDFFVHADGTYDFNIGTKTIGGC